MNRARWTPTVAMFALETAVRRGDRRGAMRAAHRLRRLGYVVESWPELRVKRRALAQRREGRA